MFWKLFYWIVMWPWELLFRSVAASGRAYERKVWGDQWPEEYARRTTPNPDIVRLQDRRGNGVMQKSYTIPDENRPDVAPELFMPGMYGGWYYGFDGGFNQTFNNESGE